MSFDLFNKRIFSALITVSLFVAGSSAMEEIHAPAFVTEAEWEASGMSVQLSGESGMVSCKTGRCVVSNGMVLVENPVFSDVPKMSMAMGAMSTATVTPSVGLSTGIEELAKALGGNVLAISQWVHDNIDYVPYFGLMQGAEITLLTRSGNDADQAALMVALCTAAGHETAYSVEQIWIPKGEVTEWVGASDINEALGAFLDGGYAQPNQIFATEDELTMLYFSPMIRVTGGDWVRYFPAIKGYRHTPRREVESLAGYSKSEVLSAAGGITTAHSAVGLNYENLDSHLSGLSSNFVAGIRETSPNATTDVLMGNREIDPSIGYDFSSTALELYYYDIPDEYRHRLLVKAGDVTFTFDQSAKGLKKVYFKYAGGVFTKCFEGYEPDPHTVSAISTIEITADRPYAAESGNYGDTTKTYAIANGGIYVLAQGYQGAFNSLVADHYNRRLSMILQDDSFDAEAKITESLALAGEVFMQEAATLQMMLSGSTGNRHILHCRTGLVGQEDGYYIDIKNQLISPYAAYAGAQDSDIKPYMMLFSGMEHAVLEQTQSTDKEAVSTVRILGLANESNNPVYRIDAFNYSSVLGQLSGYTIEQKNKFQQTAIDGGQVVLPKNANVTLNDWTGEGYIENYHLGEGHEGLFVAISGGYKGSYGSIFGQYDEFQLDQNTKNNFFNNAENWHPAAADPVDMVTGAYMFDHSDLTMDGPLPLTLSRHYISSSNTQKGPMGYGWTHSYNIRAQKHSGYEVGMGMRTPEDAASFYVASMVVRDLVENATTAKEWLTASLVVNWAMDQLTDNAVSIYVGQKVMTFIEQPDGSYTAPPGMTASLAKEGGLYVMQERHGKRYEFDANLNLAEIEGQHGNTLTFAYNTQTNLQTVTSSFGPAFTFGYNTSNLLASVLDNDGRSISYQYDNDNNLTNYVDAAGFDWGVGYDSEHRVKWMKDPEQVTTIQNFYNSIGQVTNQISSSGNDWDFYFTGTRNVSEDPLGNQTAYYLDSKDRTWSVEQPNGARSYSVFDGQNHVVQSIAPNGVTNAMVYDVDHNLLATTNAVGLPEQGVSTFGYDSNHHLRFVTNAVDTTEQTIAEYTYTTEHKVDTVTVAKGTSLEIVTDYNYNLDGLVEQISEGNGKRITTYNYDFNNQYGHPWKVNSTDAGEMVTIYDKQGNLQSQMVDGKITEFNYDDRRLQTGTTYAKGSSHEFSISQTYWKNGLLKTSTDGRGGITHHYWTDAYKQAGVVLPNTGSTTNLYDTADRLIYARDAEGNWATNTLNKVGLPVSVSSVYSVVTNQFDIIGNLTNSVVDPASLNLWRASSYDSLNRIKSVQSAGSVDHFQYDSFGRTTNRVNATSKDWKTEYDELDRVKKTFRPSGNYEEYGFDDLGNRTHFWNAEFKPTTFGVDAQGRVTSITNAIDKVTEFSFDDAGNLSQRTAADLKVTDYGYNDLNRLVAITNESVEVATFDYDPNGNILNHEDSKGTKIEFGYDEMNRITNVTSAVGNSLFNIQYSHDLNGNRTNIVYPGGLTVGYSFGADNRLEGVTTKYANNTKTISFGYDTANRLDGISYPNGVNSTFGLDPEGRVTRIIHGSFVNRQIIRNALGFKTTEMINAGTKPTVLTTERRIKTHNDADQLVSEQVQSGTNWIDVTYSYSPNGCLTNNSETGQNLGYDYDNRLLSVDNIEYLYDASGARVGRVDGTVTNYFVIDYTDGLKRPLAETDASGTITRFYVWSGSQLLCHIEANGDVRYYHSDELGSTLALTDGSGNVTDEFAYMPYGYAAHTPHAGSSDTPFQWLGGYGVYYDSDTDLHLTLHRAYSSKLKRFIHPDPLGIDGGVNVYMWANLNPLAFVDPYGLCAESFWSRAGSTAAGYATSALDFVLPDARVVNLSANAGFVGAMGGGGQLVENYRSGEVSLFGYGSGGVGLQLGDFAGEVGYIWNLENNDAYSGQATTIDGSYAIFNVSVSLSDVEDRSDRNFAITGGAGLSFLPINGRVSRQTYLNPIDVPYVKPTSPILNLGHQVLNWLEDKAK